MTNSGDKRAQPPGEGASEPVGDAPAEGKRSGRISYDERGNSVWEWQLETGVYSRDISTQRFKKLDLNDLSIADSAIHRRPPGLGGSHPYDNSSTADGNVGSNPYNSAGGAPLKPGELKRKPTDPKKLQEWLELRKRVERNERDGE